MYPIKVPSSQSEFEELYGVLLNQVPRLKSRTTITELSGGLTNRNLLITTDSGKYVARISSNDSSLLSIDRDAEYENSKRAAENNIGAPVFDYLAGQGLLVIGYLPGRTCSAEDVSQNLDRIAQSCRTLHASQRFINDFDMFKIQTRYLKVVQERGFRLPDRYRDYEIQIGKIAKALAVLAEETVPCNNDLLPGNFIDDGKKIWLIDYEYSGNNDPCFELGNIWAEAFLDLEKLEELVTAYYGVSRPEKFARAWLFALLAKYGWTLWASIQSSASTLDFDFWEWGIHKYGEAERAFNSKEFEEMLAQAASKPSA